MEDDYSEDSEESDVSEKSDRGDEILVGTIGKLNPSADYFPMCILWCPIPGKSILIKTIFHISNF